MRNCVECASSDKILKCRTQPIVKRKQADGPWSDISIDILGPVRRNTHDKYVLVCMDMYSRWPEIKVVNSIESSVVIGFLDELFEREGFPSSLLSDNGVQFTPKIFEDFLSSREVSLYWS